MTNSYKNFLGRELREIRQARGLTRREVEELTYVSEESIRRIETGVNSPSLYSLYLLLKTYGVDPRDFLGQIEGSSAGKLKDFSQEMDSLINKMEYEKAQEFLDSLPALIKNPSPEVERDMEVASLLYQGILHTEIDHECQEALNLQEEAMKKYKKDFRVHDLYAYTYKKPIEKKILNAISLSLYDLGSGQEYVKVLEKLEEDTDKKDPQYNLFASNLASAYSREGNHEECKKTCEKGILAFRENKSISFVNLYYYILAIEDGKSGNLKRAEELGKKALFLTELSASERLYNFIEEHLNKYIIQK